MTGVSNKKSHIMDVGDIHHMRFWEESIINLWQINQGNKKGFLPRKTK
jgi:hypothetical protein